jgi:predicted O-methyltransferase YrrM
MNQNWDLHFPEQLANIRRATEAAGFRMASDDLTGSLLRCLAASKSKGVLLELGTGTGMGTSWLLSGMDASSTLDSVDNDKGVLDIARRYLGDDPRVRFHLTDGASFLVSLRDRQFDLIFADTWPGISNALSLLRSGGLYIVDDLLPQPSWPEGHAPQVPAFLHALEQHREFYVTRLVWSTGLVIATRRST